MKKIIESKQQTEITVKNGITYVNGKKSAEIDKTYDMSSLYPGLVSFK